MARRDGRAAVLLALLTAAPPAAAQDPGDARDLALRGRAAFDRGDLATGCPLLEKAYALDGALLGTGFALAECREKEGKVATAHRLFVEIAAKAAARGEERAAEARARASALAPRLPRLRVDVAVEARELPGLVVTVDGAPWPPERWGAAAPIDGGAHQLTATADGRPPWSTRVEAVEGTTVEVRVPLERAAEPVVEPSGPAPAGAATHDEARGGVPWRAAGLVTAGVGAGVLGVGVVLGLAAKSDYDAVAGCDADGACTPAAAAEREDARSLADVGTALFIAGGVLAAGGLTVFLVAPDDEAEATAALRVAPGGATLRGRF
jgi:hypothetical protein